MTYYIKFEIPGKVKAKQSFKIGRNGFKYTPSEVKSYANWVRLCFQKEYPKHLPSTYHEKQLRMNIEVHFAIPKSFSKKKREDALNRIVRPTVKPDCDNISKNICDALNGIVFPDDKQIVSLEVEKYYSENESVIVRVYDL
jgi:Holliday junction resolvase RusA-like endonuclease